MYVYVNMYVDANMNAFILTPLSSKYIYICISIYNFLRSYFMRRHKQLYPVGYFQSGVIYTVLRNSNIFTKIYYILMRTFPRKCFAGYFCINLFTSFLIQVSSIYGGGSLASAVQAELFPELHYIYLRSHGCCQLDCEQFTFNSFPQIFS